MGAVHSVPVADGDWAKTIGEPELGGTQKMQLGVNDRLDCHVSAEYF